jgi:hypothetical protein
MENIMSVTYSWYKGKNEGKKEAGHHRRHRE